MEYIRNNGDKVIVDGDKVWKSDDGTMKKSNI